MIEAVHERCHANLKVSTKGLAGKEHTNFCFDTTLRYVSVLVMPMLHALQCFTFCNALCKLEGETLPDETSKKAK